MLIEQRYEAALPPPYLLEQLPPVPPRAKNVTGDIVAENTDLATALMVCTAQMDGVRAWRDTTKTALDALNAKGTN